MQNIKTAIVVTVLLMTVYGVYRVLNQPEPAPTQAMADLERRFQGDALDIEVEGEKQSDADASLAPPRVDLGSDAEPVASGDMSSTPDESPDSDQLPPLPEHASEPSAYSRRSPTATEPDNSAASDLAAPEGDRAPRNGTEVPDDHHHEQASGSSDASPDAAPTGPEAAPGREPATTGQVGRAFETAWREAQTQVEQGAYAAALQKLSVFYNSPDLTADQHQQLLGLLDPLAGKVIYSTEHLIVEPHRIGSRETLSDIAKQYHVPWQLLQNINGIENPDVLVPGQELKVVPGPFHAEVDLRRSELTVFAKDLYAGRFYTSIGNEPPPVAGEYQVREKRTDRDYITTSGTAIPADDPENPYGGVWIDLGHRLCIHGSPRTADRGAVAPGCIGLAPRDAADVFGILSEGSVVTVRR